jgi:hypothetical protein
LVRIAEISYSCAIVSNRLLATILRSVEDDIGYMNLNILARFVISTIAYFKVEIWVFKSLYIISLIFWLRISRYRADLDAAPRCAARAFSCGAFFLLAQASKFTLAIGLLSLCQI